jgi:hypothetical protein
MVLLEPARRPAIQVDRTSYASRRLLVVVIVVLVVVIVIVVLFLLHRLYRTKNDRSRPPQRESDVVAGARRRGDYYFILEQLRVLYQVLLYPASNSSFSLFYSLSVKSKQPKTTTAAKSLLLETNKNNFFKLYIL